MLVAYGAVYAHYERGWGGAAAGLLNRRLRRTFGMPLRFSRFDNVSLAGGLAGSVEESLATTSTTTMAATSQRASDSGGGALVVQPQMTAFDNPLFRSAGGSAVEIVTAERGPNVLNESAAAATAGDAVHELGFESASLIEVDLDSSETKI